MNNALSHLTLALVVIAIVPLHPRQPHSPGAVLPCSSFLPRCLTGTPACWISSENRPQTVILANVALFSPYFARANPDSPEGRPGRSSC
eukprot:scaffold4781_cov73-Cyclotella_meneghiniana.AAC.1